MRLRLLTLLLLLLFTVTTTAQDDPRLTYAYTYHQPSGNRFVAGQGTFPAVRAYDLQLKRPIFWVVGSGAEYAFYGIPTAMPLWATITADDTERYLAVVDNQLTEVFSRETALSVIRPPFMYMDDTGQPFMLNAPDGSDLSHPMLLPNGAWVYVTSDGSVTPGGAIDMSGIDIDATPLPLNALPDARIVVNGAGQIAVYVGATNQRYVHGVIGDLFEAAALAVLEIEGDELKVVARVDLPESDVFEGISPFWADVDQDGADDLIVTVSNLTVGAQIRAYRADGSLLATGPAIGRGGRWRHQLAFGPFGPNGEQELVDVLTPHIGGVVEFYRLNGDQLEIVASLPGYTSHLIGSNNLDMTVAGDFNGDGQPEIILPIQNRTAIAGLQHTADGVQEVWRLPLDAPLLTNLSAVTLPDNRLALAAGMIDGRLRVWLPEG